MRDKKRDEHEMKPPDRLYGTTWKEFYSLMHIIFEFCPPKRTKINHRSLTQISNALTLHALFSRRHRPPIFTVVVKTISTCAQLYQRNSVVVVFMVVEVVVEVVAVKIVIYFAVVVRSWLALSVASCASDGGDVVEIHRVSVVRNMITVAQFVYCVL